VDLIDLVLGDEVLRGSALIKALGENAARSALKLGIGRRYPDKVTIFRQSDAGDSLYLVLRGEARLFATTGKDIVELGSAAKGDVFGEAEILGSTGARDSSAIASGNLDVVELPRKSLVDTEPAVRVYLEQLQSKRRAAVDEMAAFLNRW
jgi:CRP-like cAMP-binding protein